MISATLVLAGHGWIAVRYGFPLRALLWNEELMRAMIEGGGGSWPEWVTSVPAGAAIDRVAAGIGWFFLAAAVTVWIPQLPRRLFASMMWAAAALLCFHGFLKFVDYGFGFAQWFERAAQIVSPLIALWIGRDRRGGRAITFILTSAIAATFVAHGLYAVGAEFRVGFITVRCPVPGDYLQMTMSILDLESADAARPILRAAGWLDFAAAIGVFVPYVRAPALVYMAIWGALTAIARVWANFDPAFAAEMLARWAPESLLRAPHALIPIIILFLLLRTHSAAKQSPKRDVS